MQQYKITIKQEGTYWAVTLWDNREMGGWYPVESCYGSTEEEATTKLVLLLKNYEFE